jgi:hypothetical protein
MNRDGVAAAVKDGAAGLVLLDESASVAGARAGQLEVLNGEGEVGVIGIVHKEPVTQKTFMS